MPLGRWRGLLEGMRGSVKATFIALLCGVVVACGATATEATSAGLAAAAKPAADRSVGVIAFGGVRWGKRSVSPRIYLVRADGKGLRQVTMVPNVEDVTPVWSPTSNAKFKGGTAHPAWSPNVQTILFSGRTSSLEDARTDISSVRPDGHGMHRLLTNADGAAWSPNGRRIAFSRRGDIYTAALAGAGLRQLTHGYYADSLVPSWSPDATRIVFSTAHYNKSKQQTSQCITVMNADGTNREITKRDPDFWATSPSWQPGT